MQKDYAAVEIPDGAVVYADPPYRDTYQEGYSSDTFDFERFDRWLASVPFMVIVSEYTCPKGCVEIANIKKQSGLGTGNKGGTDTEKLFVQERFYKKYLQEMGRII